MGAWWRVQAKRTWAAVAPWGQAGLNNSGPHGFSEILYAYSSVTANNGSAFAGLTASTPWYDDTLAAAMFIGRFLMIIPIMAMAGAFAAKKRVAEFMTGVTAASSSRLPV